MSVLAIDDIHTYYGESYVLQGVSLSVEPGTIVALLGRNGVGKTTTIRSVIGFTPARRGKILFKGADITHEPAYAIARRGVGLVPQGRRIFGSLSVEEQITLGAGGADGQWGLERVLRVVSSIEGTQAPARDYAVRWRTIHALDR